MGDKTVKNPIPISGTINNSGTIDNQGTIYNAGAINDVLPSGTFNYDTGTLNGNLVTCTPPCTQAQVVNQGSNPYVLYNGCQNIPQTNITGSHAYLWVYLEVKDGHDRKRITLLDRAQKSHSK